MYLYFDHAMSHEVRCRIFHWCHPTDAQKALDLETVCISDFQIRDAQLVRPLEKHLRNVDTHIWDMHTELHLLLTLESEHCYR